MNKDCSQHWSSPADTTRLNKDIACWLEDLALHCQNELLWPQIILLMILKGLSKILRGLITWLLLQTIVSRRLLHGRETFTRMEVWRISRSSRVFSYDFLLRLILLLALVILVIWLTLHSWLAVGWWVKGSAGNFTQATGFMSSCIVSFFKSSTLLLVCTLDWCTSSTWLLRSQKLPS